ncbi:hypothetical protein D5F01_LYC24691 [Larimichthys crocea]|uniref:Uncharacterized protein n=1 Tax=Larimichthys crocea TaxID=215358 RepID=A0A6G0HEG9_LARCR|nr:hypothetical protein D5F01_LYC24691 [Larimichthys crocea]
MRTWRRTHPGIGTTIRAHCGVQDNQEVPLRWRAPRIAAPRPGRSAPGAGKIRSRRGDRVFSKGRCVYTFTNTAPTRQTPCPPPQPINPPIQLEGRGKAREMGDPVRTIQPTPKGRGKGRERRMDDENQMEGPQDCRTKTRQECPRSRTSRDRALPSQVPQEKEGTRPAVLPLPPGTPKTPILSQKTCTDLQLNPRVPPGERPGPAPTERCLPERARRRRKGSAMPKHHFPRTSKTPMLKSKMPPTEQKGNGTAEASAFPVHSREGVTRASRDRALPPWPLQASRLG